MNFADVAGSALFTRLTTGLTAAATILFSPDGAGAACGLAGAGVEGLPVVGAGVAPGVEVTSAVADPGSAICPVLLDFAGAAGAAACGFAPFPGAAALDEDAAAVTVLLSSAAREFFTLFR
jgi:hypothetical protein